jgi:tetratricopeptide (TPR) repeat protein
MQLRGMINLRRKRDRRALKDFTSAIKAPHEDMELRSISFANRGLTFMRLQEYDKAVSDFNKAIQLDRKSAFAYAGRALAYLRKDEIARARQDAKRALGMKPDKETSKVARRVLSSLSVSFSGSDRVSVPIGDHGHIFVQVRFGKAGKPHRFLLDTGATHTLVSKTLLDSIRKETEVKKIGTGKVITADGATHLVTRYMAKDAFLFNLPLGDVELHVFVGSHKRSSNLLGAQSLRNLSLSIDTAARKAEIRRIEPD